VPIQRAYPLDDVDETRIHETGARSARDRGVGAVGEAHKTRTKDTLPEESGLAALTRHLKPHPCHTAAGLFLDRTCAKQDFERQRLPATTRGWFVIGGFGA
jgi:hypothetical protein